MIIFDNEAKEYDNWYETKLGKFVDKIETKCAFDMLELKKGMNVLDIGCGTGNYSIKLANMGLIVTGIDISNKMLEVAREKTVKRNLNINYQNMDIYDLKFENDKFDFVFTMAAFEFIDNPEKAINEMFRVLKKDGYLLIGTINKDSLWGELYSSKEFQKNSVFKYANFKRIDDLVNLKTDNLIKTSSCLFIPPNSGDDDITIEKETELSKVNKGGFICALWKK